jgi:hypothetical protein
VGKNSTYFGLLDSCKDSYAEPVTVFSADIDPKNLDITFWGNKDNGNPQIDWEGTEDGTTVNELNRWSFSYCMHLVGNEYDLNEGGKFGDLYCTATAKSATWLTYAEATTAAITAASTAP